MSIGSVLKPNDLVEIAVLPRSSVVAYREGIKLVFASSTSTVLRAKMRGLSKSCCFLLLLLFLLFFVLSR